MSFSDSSCQLWMGQLWSAFWRDLRKNEGKTRFFHSLFMGKTRERGACRIFFISSNFCRFQSNFLFFSWSRSEIPLRTDLRFFQSDPQHPKHPSAQLPVAVWMATRTTNKPPNFVGAPKCTGLRHCWLIRKLDGQKTRHRVRFFLGSEPATW